jgi:hypothetical protein
MVTDPQTLDLQKCHYIFIYLMSVFGQIPTMSIWKCTHRAYCSRIIFFGTFDIEVSIIDLKLV